MRFSLSNKKAFTATEMAMVAAIIAMFALLVLPQFRARVDEARITAAKADLESFMKAEMLARAEIGNYLRLEDLDNVQDNLPAVMPSVGVTNEVPFFVYPYNGNPATNRVGMSETAWRAFAKKFKGPYAALPNTLTLGEIRNAVTNPIGQYILRSMTGNPLSPIQDMTTNTSGGPFDSLNNRIPVDPWGNPYLFYPATGNTGSDDTSFYNCLIVSLGADGKPGLLDGVTATDYLRNKGSAWIGIGTNDPGSDDIKLEF